MIRRNSRIRAYAPDPESPGRTCDAPECNAMGEYRAPKSRNSLRDYWWFCLDHVRGYNATWDYYKGMTPGEIEAGLRSDTSWQRPSWPLGHLGAGSWRDELVNDPLHVLDVAGLRGTARHTREQTPAELREPLATLGLSWPTTLDQVKTRYKELAKRHHPDANGGDRAAEERLKTINIAYATLRSRLNAAVHAAAG
jgi:DnaJ domain